MPKKYFLRQVDIFYDLSADLLKKVAAICQPVTYNAGDLVFAENSTSDEMYIVVQGAVKIQVDPAILGLDNPPGPGPTTIATLHAGQVFGEVALVDRGVRSAAARCANRPTQLLVINGHKKGGADPPVRRGLSTRLSNHAQHRRRSGFQNTRC